MDIKKSKFYGVYIGDTGDTLVTWEDNHTAIYVTKKRAKEVKKLLEERYGKQGFIIRRVGVKYLEE